MTLLVHSTRISFQAVMMEMHYLAERDGRSSSVCGSGLPQTETERWRQKSMFCSDGLPYVCPLGLQFLIKCRQSVRVFPAPDGASRLARRPQTRSPHLRPLTRGPALRKGRDAEEIETRAIT